MAGRELAANRNLASFLASPMGKRHIARGLASVYSFELSRASVSARVCAHARVRPRVCVKVHVCVCVCARVLEEEPEDLSTREQGERRPSTVCEAAKQQR